MTESPELPLPYGRPVRRRIALPIAAAAAIVLLVVWLAAHSNVSPDQVDGVSMEPTLASGQRLEIDDGLRRPHVGEIVIFHPPAGADPAVPVCGIGDEGSGWPAPCGVDDGSESHETLIKRVVAGPGDTVAIVGGHVIRNGVAEKEPGIPGCAGLGCNFPAPVTVPPGDYYLLGDNRAVSDDSRFWGPVPAAWLIGTVVSCAWLETFCHPLG